MGGKTCPGPACCNLDDDSNGSWCSTKVDANDVHVGGHFVYCKGTPCSASSANKPGKKCWANKQPCVFPFKKNGKTCAGPGCCNLDNDSSGNWCSTKVDANDVHIGGNFVYCKGKPCNVQKPWNKKCWKNKGKPCVFPFKKNGKTCPGPACCNLDDDSNGSWCSTKVDANDVHIGGNFVYCKGTPCNVKKPAKKCWENKKTCIFPFRQNQKTCAGPGCCNLDNDSGGSWCSTKVDANDFTISGQFVYCKGTPCNVKKPWNNKCWKNKGNPCVFPFKKNGKTCPGPRCCNLDDHSSGAWCSTKVDAKGVHVGGHFVYCKGTPCRHKTWKAGKKDFVPQEDETEQQQGEDEEDEEEVPA